MASLDETLSRYRGVGPGFDFLRIGLAASIVSVHSFLLTGNDDVIRHTSAWFIEYALVPCFFALSGFLVAGSGLRLSLGNFLINRGLRILPALAVDIVVCALIIGPLFTTASFREYFGDTRFYLYFLNITGWIHYSLPGVFEHNVSQRVNGALWTVPYEMLCYMVMSGLIVSRWIGKPLYVLVLTVSMLVAGIFVQHYLGGMSGTTKEILSFVFVDRGSQLIVAFLLGVLVFQMKSSIPYSAALFIACCLICVVAAMFLTTDAIYSVKNRFVLLPALTYITIFLGLTPIPLPKVFHSGDYSYGVYLYHDPLLQAIILLAPSVVIAQTVGAIALLSMGIPAVALLAIFSWHVIEKPILGLRKKFSFVAKVRGVDDAPPAPAALPQTAPPA